VCSQRAVDLFNPEQLQIHDDILEAILSDHALQIFVDGKAGMEKTFLVNAICDKVRSMGRVVLPTAIAAFAAQHYAGGHTTHSAFKVRICTTSRTKTTITSF
jgi:hypothetical protein